MTRAPEARPVRPLHSKRRMLFGALASLALALAPAVLTAGPANAATASVVLTVTPTTAESNVAATANMSVTCNGPGSCDGTQVSIPTNAVTGNGTRTDFGTWIGGAACPGVTRTVTGGFATFTWATLAPGTQTCAFTVRAPEYTTLNGAVATLTPTASGPGLPTVTGAAATLTVTAGHNISTQITGPTKILSGGQFSYSLILNCGALRQYDGDIGATAIQLQAQLPANFVYAGYTPRNGFPGTYTTPAVGSSGGTFVYDDPTGASCSTPLLNVDNAVIITIQGSVTAAAGTTACATASSSFTYIDRTTPETQNATMATCPTIVNLATIVSKTAATHSMGNVGQYTFTGSRYAYTFPGDWDQTKASLSYAIKASTSPGQIAAGLSYRITDPLPCLDNLSGIIYSSNASGALCQNPGFIPVRITATSFAPAATDAVHLLFADGTTADIPYVASAWTMPTAPASPISEIQFPPFASEGLNTGTTVTFTVDGYASAAAVPGRVLRNTMTSQSYLSDAANPTGSAIGVPQTGIANAGIVDQHAGAGDTGAPIVLPYLTNTVTGACVANVGMRTASGRAAQLELTKAPAEPIYINYLAPPGASLASTTVSPTLRAVYLSSRTFAAGALTATVTADYNGTGRTMYAWAIPAGVVTIPGLYEVLNFAITVNLPAGCAGTYPSDITVGYQSQITNCVWTNFVSPFSQTPPLAPLNNGDLNTNGSPIPGNYCGYSSPISVAAVGQGFSIAKTVQGSLDGAPAVSVGGAEAVGEVGASGGEATYTVTFTNNGATILTDPVVYDLLPQVGDTPANSLDPRNSQFDVALASVTVPPAGVTVQYSTSDNPCRSEVLAVNPGCVNDWSSTAPTPLSSATALRYFRAGTLAVGAAFTVVYDVTTPAITAGRLAHNSAGANASAGGTPVGAAESDTVGLEAAGQPAIVKTASTPTFDTVGQTVTFTYTVTNQATVPVTAVGVTDAFTDAAAGSTPGAVTCQSLTGPAGACTGPTADLAAGQTAIFTMTYTVRQQDLDHGLLTDQATVSASPARGPALSNTSNAVTVTADQNPALALTKTVNPTTANAAGQTVSYSFLVTNSGNVTVTTVGINETVFTGAGPTPLATCPASMLAPGISTTCTATYVLLQDDIDAGVLDNTAVATAELEGTGVLSPASSARVTIVQDPSLTLDKTSNLATVGASGQTITYSFLVTNDGNVTIDSVLVSEVSFSGSAAMSAITCPTTVLAPTDDMTCTATYSVTQADIDSGSIDNEATVTGDDPAGAAIPAPPTSSVQVPVVFAPALTVTKTANVTHVAQPGATIRYSFLVINNGNTTLNGLTIAETAFSGAGAMGAITCPVATLAPTAQTTCTADYTVVAADARSSRISNTAEANATYARAGLPVTVTSAASTALVAVDPAVSGLAMTGSEAWKWWAVAAVIAIGIGIGIVYVMRRRPTAKVA